MRTRHRFFKPVNKLALMSAASMVLAAQAGFAGEGQGKQPFSEVDQNGDNQVEWQELQQAHDGKISQANLDEQQVMNAFDRDQDDALDEQEYRDFVTTINNIQGDRTAAAGEQGDNARGRTVTPSAGTQGSMAEEELQQEPAMAAQTQGAGASGDAAEGELDVAREENQPSGQGSAWNEGEEEQRTAGTTGTGTPAGTESQSTGAAGADGLQGMNPDQVADQDVVNQQGEEVGRVADVVRSEDGGQTGLVVSVGGFWGIGGKEILVDLDEVQLSEDRVVWQTDASEDELKDMPEYNEADYVSVR